MNFSVLNWIFHKEIMSMEVFNIKKLSLFLFLMTRNSWHMHYLKFIFLPFLTFLSTFTSYLHLPISFALLHYQRCTLGPIKSKFFKKKINIILTLKLQHSSRCLVAQIWEQVSDAHDLNFKIPEYISRYGYRQGD